MRPGPVHSHSLHAPTSWRQEVDELLPKAAATHLPTDCYDRCSLKLDICEGIEWLDNPRSCKLII